MNECEKEETELREGVDAQGRAWMAEFVRPAAAAARRREIRKLYTEMAAIVTLILARVVVCAAALWIGYGIRAEVRELHAAYQLGVKQLAVMEFGVMHQNDGEETEPMPNGPGALGHSGPTMAVPSIVPPTPFPVSIVPDVNFANVPTMAVGGEGWAVQ